jgi:predicted ATPase
VSARTDSRTSTLQPGCSSSASPTSRLYERRGFLAEDADGGTVFVPLARVRDTTLVVPLIAERLGASGDSPAAIATRMGEKRTHVVLDNLEQLLPDAARPLAELLLPPRRFGSWRRAASRCG